jgi:hypothetical protein
MCRKKVYYSCDILSGDLGNVPTRAAHVLLYVRISTIMEPAEEIEELLRYMEHL